MQALRYVGEHVDGAQQYVRRRVVKLAIPLLLLLRGARVGA